ncbi:hypothetical protein EYZ11_013444 [Aspergillus tanneri]|uniref:Uncharacterized protein n=1 Tax=Aspergillus tanneri TaxID=1220188 RepID=A0A4S3IXM3_9EURO|nr:uncharacterized protein ATNIH1004_009542 [Aspergillus tanneri]KAA8642790.1 hypothetical protein ATNIH1004_009542 [Aspergillus tanneri]THC87110.1 hypothetical protein EYZ11_013444 [Aspergillus tanneri]
MLFGNRYSAVRLQISEFELLLEVGFIKRDPVLCGGPSTPYTLQSTLSIITGRPTSTPDKFTTTPLSIPFDEEQFGEPMAASLLMDFSARKDYMQALTSQRRVAPTGWDSPALAEVVGQDIGLNYARHYFQHLSTSSTL